MALRLLPLDTAGRFEAAMGQKPVSRTTHFMLHVMVDRNLSTASAGPPPGPVDDSTVPSAGQALADAAVRLGMVVPKRHARRSVTRNLVRRQMREGLRRRLAVLPAGDWVLRLRSPFDRQAFPSAASDALRASVRAELDQLLHDALRRLAAPRRHQPT